MRWFKHPPTDTKRYCALSWEERGMLARVISACTAVNDFHLTSYWLCQLLQIRRPKALTLLDKFQPILDEFKGRNSSVTHTPNPIESTNFNSPIEIERERERNIERKNTTPLPPSQGDGQGLDFSKIPEGLNHPKLRLVDTRTNTDISEMEWLQRQLLSHLQSARIRVNLIDQSLSGLMYLNPEADKLGRCWLAKSDAERMAALSFARSKPSVAHELRYAIQAIDGQWEDYRKLLPAARLAIESGDYTVEVHNG